MVVSTINGVNASLAEVTGCIVANLGLICCGRVLGKDAVTVSTEYLVVDKRALVHLRLNGRVALNERIMLPPGKGREQFAQWARNLAHVMREAVDGEFDRQWNEAWEAATAPAAMLSH